MLAMKRRPLKTEALWGICFAAGGSLPYLEQVPVRSSAVVAAILFPRVIGACLVMVGVLIASRSILRRAELGAAQSPSPRAMVTPLLAPPRSTNLRALLTIIGGVLAYAALIEKAGLFVAVNVTGLIAALGFRSARLRSACVFGVCLAIAVSLLFVGLLRLPLELVPGF